MKFRIPALAILAVVSTALVAQAQTAPAGLIAAYKAGVAAEKCGLNLDSEKSSQLGDAVQRNEQRSGLAQADLDALYAKTQSDADADTAGFCGNAAALVDKVIAAAQ